MEYFRLRRVKAVSPLGRKTRWSRSAHSRHSGLSFSIFNRFPFHNSTPHSEHLESRSMENTTRSAPLLEVSTSLGFIVNRPVPSNSPLNRRPCANPHIARRLEL